MVETFRFTDMNLSRRNPDIQVPDFFWKLIVPGFVRFWLIELFQNLTHSCMIFRHVDSVRAVYIRFVLLMLARLENESL